jgi:hypothetical protein
MKIDCEYNYYFNMIKGTLLKHRLTLIYAKIKLNLR